MKSIPCPLKIFREPDINAHKKPKMLPTVKIKIQSR